MQSILLYSMVLSRWGRRCTYMRRDDEEEGGPEFSSKRPRTMSNLPDFPRRPFLYAHLCFYTKSMRQSVGVKALASKRWHQSVGVKGLASKLWHQFIGAKALTSQR